MNEYVKTAMETYEESARALCDEVEEAYPVDTVLDVELGGHVITVRVTGHSSSWWHDPGTMGGRNIETGKLRRFTPTDIRD